MSTFTGADLIADALAQLEIQHVFGIVSIHNMPLLDAINRLGKTKIINVRHEQAGTHAADGYARATGKLGVMIASTGPGTSNTVTGLYEAQYGSSRVLVITGQAETAFYGRGVGYVHEAENQVAMLRSVCRRVESPRHINQLGSCLQTVVTDLFTGRPAPGALEIPIDLQYAAATTMEFGYPTSDPAQP
ncbi:MAG: thiamine pyrophosphate-binding protein, partial [Gammaproteobacteria bacterium]|nr:thiamine pyrophosphate-binding protein [Gammaproteobacteria bacterium]